jgi:hypothetical protein
VNSDVIGRIPRAALPDRTVRMSWMTTAPQADSVPRDQRASGGRKGVRFV